MPSFGDEIIAGGHARSEFRRCGQRVRILDKRGRPRWSDLWQGLDWIVPPHEKGEFAAIHNGPGCRPYIHYPFDGRSCRYSGWRVRDHIGGIFFTESEYAFAQRALANGPFVLIEPNLAATSNQNKQWGWERWRELVRQAPEMPWLQIGPSKSRRLEGVRFLETGTFRLAAAVLSLSRAAVLPEGALHHAAGVLGKRAVVLFGGAVDAEAMGYPWHCNIVDPGPDSPCGHWKPCEHCARAWAKIKPAEIAEKLHHLVAVDAAA